jgi:hypothetical protein
VAVNKKKERKKVSIYWLSEHARLTFIILLFTTVLSHSPSDLYNLPLLYVQVNLIEFQYITCRQIWDWSMHGAVHIRRNFDNCGWCGGGEGWRWVDSDNQQDYLRYLGIPSIPTPKITKLLCRMVGYLNQSPYFWTFIEPRNRFQGMNSASLCSLAGRYDNPIPSRILAPMDSLTSETTYMFALCHTSLACGR